MVVCWVVRNESVRDTEAVFVDDIADLRGKIVKGGHPRRPELEGGMSERPRTRL